MPNVVVAGGKIQCNHGGLRELPQGDGRLEIGSSAAVTAGMEEGLSFAPGPGVAVPCPLPDPKVPGNLSPCTSTLKATTGVSTRVTVGSLGVLLDNASGPAVNPSDPTAKWSVAQPGQMLLDVDH